MILKTSSQKYFFNTLSVKWALLSKKPKGADIFLPLQCQTQGDDAPPEIDASGQRWMKFSFYEN